MISKLRRNFILVAMCSTLAVLAVIIGALNFASYQGVVRRGDFLLDMLAENDAAFPEEPFWQQDMPQGAADAFPEDAFSEGGKPLPGGDRKLGDRSFAGNGFTPETPYETRFFTVNFDARGSVFMVDTGKVAAVETQDAVAYAEEVYHSGRKRGFYGTYRYLRVEKEDFTRLIFVDCGRELNSFRNLAKSSAAVSLLGFLAVLLLVLIFSKKVFRPVAESAARQKQFITDASHELKTPLAIISANVEILEMEGQENEWTKSIHNQVSRLTSLTEQLVMLSRMDEEGQEQNFAEFAFSDAVRETAEGFLPLAKAREKELVLQIEEGVRYKGDEGMLRQMVSLLLDNAIKYSSQRGRIELALGRRGRKIQLTVWNTVDSVDQRELSLLFERFYRPDSSRNSATGGSGIGLSIVKAVAERHGGQVSVRSGDGKSVRFLVTL